MRTRSFVTGTMQRHLLLSTALAGLLSALPAAAHGAETTERASPVATRSFTSEDFVQYAPRTALDMVRQIPGFSIQGGNNGERGLGQADQNVLLNGQRVSGKSNDAVTALSRIDAANVVRIDLVEGASLDIPGLSGEVANIIYKVDSFSGTFAWRPEIRERLEDNWLAGEVAFAGKLGSFDWNGSIANNAFRRGNYGIETAERFDGTLIVTRDEISRFYRDEPRLTFGLARETANGNIFNFNAVGELSFFDRIEDGVETLADGAISDRLSDRGQEEWSIELGGDYAFALGPGRLKLIGLYRIEREDVVSEFSLIDRAPAVLPIGSRFLQDSDTSEIIARGEYGWGGGNSDWQVSVEGALNSLDSSGELFALDADGVLQPVEFNGATARIEEERVEAFLSHSRDLGGGLALQANLGGEYSRIEAIGSPDGPRSFFRPKGSLAVNWTASGALTVSARIERSVDQLNFGDFLASVDLTDDLGRDSNLALVPPQRWQAELEVIKEIGRWGSIRPFARYQIVEDVIETIPIGETGQALGNLDRATLWQIGSDGTLLLDPLGWAGARVDFELAVGGSSIEDPLTGQRRQVSGRELIDVEADLRHDIPGSDWAWGGRISYRDAAREVRLGNIDRRYDTGPDISLFAEHKDLAGMTARLTVGNLLDRRDGFERFIWDGRRIGEYETREFRERSFGRTIAFSLTGAF
ncbi:TonB-dependent receptor plug domain-containing protein [Sphingomicrobium flavum]|uniref:TonB-dependent receptor plug domain-containing protein n=1 Tax=Sphingomicrobium flavum TaxID=1229164 RepID=UPI0021AE2C25|nr:TonB-dependent receptor plug domain-containing protein [Sphingomicrobium flavum]